MSTNPTTFIKNGQLEKKENECKKITNSCIQMEQVPFKFQGVIMTSEDGLTKFGEVCDDSFVNINQFKCDYDNGRLLFNPSQEGQSVKYSYYGTGYTLISADRICYTNGNGIITLKQMLEQVMSTSDIYKITKQIEEMKANTDEALKNIKNAMDEENIRKINEEERKAKIEQIMEIVNAFTVCEEYNPSKKYKRFNKVIYEGALYECVKDCDNILPTTREYWICISMIKANDNNEGNGVIITEKPIKLKKNQVAFVRLKINNAPR